MLEVKERIKTFCQKNLKQDKFSEVKDCINVNFTCCLMAQRRQKQEIMRGGCLCDSKLNPENGFNCIPKPGCYASE